MLRLAGAHSVERAGANRNDVGRRRNRGLAEDIDFRRALGRRGLDLARLGQRRGQLASIRIEGRLGRGLSFVSICGWRSEIHFRWFGGAFGRPRIGAKLACGCFGRRLFRELTAFPRDDLLAQDAKTAVAQEFPMAAEQGRSRKRDPSAPIRARERPADNDPGESLPPGKGPDEHAAAFEFDAAEQSLDGLAALRRVGAGRSRERGMGGAETALSVKRPQKARIQRPGCARNRRRGLLGRRSVVPVGGRRRFGARRAQGRNRRQKPCRAPRRGDTGAAKIDVDCPPPGDETHAFEPRRPAEGKRRREMAEAPRARSLAPHEPRFERVRAVDPEESEYGRTRNDDPSRRGQDRQPGAVADPVRRRQPRVESRGFPVRLERGFRGRRRRREGQSRRSQRTIRPARSAADGADDSGFIVSESLTPLTRFHHGAGAADWEQG